MDAGQWRQYYVIGTFVCASMEFVAVIEWTMEAVDYVKFPMMDKHTIKQMVIMFCFIGVYMNEKNIPKFTYLFNLTLRI